MKTKTIYLLAAIFISLNSFGQQYQFHLDRNIDIYGEPVKSTIQENLKGNFTGDLVYYIVEVINGVKHYTIDEEISFSSKPIINETFDIYRSTD